MHKIKDLIKVFCVYFSVEAWAQSKLILERGVYIINILERAVYIINILERGVYIININNLDCL